MKLKDCFINFNDQLVMFKFVSDCGTSIYLEDFINSSSAFLDKFYNLFGSFEVDLVYIHNDYFKIVLKFDVSNLEEILDVLFAFGSYEVVYA